jgi:LuxR family quorum sensing-dependent transcriptional regulator
VLHFECFVEQSQRAESVAELEALFVRVMAEEGFENYFLGSITQHNVLSATWLAFTEGHFETYLAERWYEVDPILSLAARATRPFCWDDAAASLMFSQRQAAMLDECKRAGVHSIIVTPFQSQDGRSDIVGISRRHAERPDARRIPILQAICAQSWCRYAELVDTSLTGEAEVAALTSRELEILRWIKHGKNNTEISEIISVAVKTIEYHVGNIFKKLGAGNRTAAVVIAIRNKLLEL